MKIDRKIALRVLEEEARASKLEACDEEWMRRVEDLSNACGVENKTYIAMLGTAILATATNPRVDPFSLKAGKEKSSNTYSARSLCKDVLAANALLLDIDLGVSGREPLNNQPFFFPLRVSEDMSVKPSQRPALHLLLAALRKLDSMQHADEGKVALRAFIKSRTRIRTKVSIAIDDGDALAESQLVELIKDFVSENSERGRRAQAVAAGLLDVYASYSRTRISQVHDPDRRFPGDVGILSTSDEEKLERIFEVRDKPVSIQDLYLLINKVSTFKVSKVGVLAINAKQPPLDLAEISAWALDFDITLHVYYGWDAFVREILFWSPHQNKLIGLAYRSILKRIPELGVSAKGLEIWVSKK